MMLVRDIMTKNVECVPPSGTIRQAAEKMKTLDVGFIPVAENRNDVIGLVTDRDITVRAVAEGRDPSSTKVSEIMTRQVSFCREDTDIREAAQIMQQNQIRRLIVKSQAGDVVGVVSLGDLAVDADQKLAGETIHDVSTPSQPRR